jgi:hypothetical protein
MGDLQMSAGSPQKARQYFQEAASSDSSAGRAAKLSLLRLDFPHNAENYIETQVGLSEKGYLLAKFSNNSQLGIKNIKLNIEYPDSSGRTRQTKRLLSGIIPAGKSYTTNLDLGPYANASVLKVIRIRITGAQLVDK